MDAQGRLRAVFAAQRGQIAGEWGLARYATVGAVRGGFTRLLSHASKRLEVKRWITFADLEISDGGLYAKHGFRVDKVLPPE